MDMVFENFSTIPLANFAIKFNTNYLGLQPDGAVKPGSIPVGGAGLFSLPLKESRDVKDIGGNPPIVQMAMKTDAGVAYFQDTMEASLLFTENGKMEKKDFLEKWKQIAQTNEISKSVTLRTSDLEAIKTRLASQNVFLVAARTVQGKGEVQYFSFSFKGVMMLAEVTVSGSNATVIVKTENIPWGGVASASLANLL